MRFDIYLDESLAATLVYGAHPSFYGSAGEQLASLLAAHEVVHNFWTRETDTGQLPERADWWASRIISAPLARSGFQLRIHGLQPDDSNAVDEPGLQLPLKVALPSYARLGAEGREAR